MIISICANKGGVAKTTTAVTLAHGLARAGHKTLLIDLDPQGHSAICLGYDPTGGVYRWLTDTAYAGTLQNCTLLARPGLPGGGWADLWLMPGDSHTKHVHVYYRGTGGFEGLCSVLAGVTWEGDFEYVVCDTSAGGILQEAAIQIAHHVVVPFRPETLGLDGVAATLEVIRQLSDHRPAPGLSFLPVMFDRRLTEHEYNVGALRDRHGILVMEPVPARVAVAEAVAMGKTTYEMSSAGALDVQAAYERLVRLMEIAKEGLPDGN